MLACLVLGGAPQRSEEQDVARLVEQLEERLPRRAPDELALALGGEYEPETMPFACEAGGGRGLE